MIQVTDLQFAIAGCCGTHESVTVERADGVTVGVIRGDEGTYSVSLYNSAGLMGREVGVGADRVEQLINA